MKILKEDLHEEVSRMTFWARIKFESDDGQRESTVLFCGSHEYLWDLFRAQKKDEVKLDEWHAKVIRKWEDLGEQIFDATVHYDVYTNSEEGLRNGLKFLKEEVTP